MKPNRKRNILHQRDELNRMLTDYGLATLDNPTDLFNQLAKAISGHDDFRRLLFKIEPEQRANCYRSLANRLSFTPKPLDVYEVEAKQEAERKRAPRMDEKTGMIYEYKPGQVDTRYSYYGMTWNGAKGRLTFNCVKCTAKAEFFGDSPVDAAVKARKELWVKDGENEICPKCPAIRPN